MELWLAIVIAALALVAGIFIGRIPIKNLYRLLENAMDAYNREKKANKELVNENNHQASQNRTMKNTLASTEAAQSEAVTAAIALHKTCKNGDNWSDHTKAHPEGMTPARRAAIAKQEREAELARQKQVKRDAEAAAKREKARKEAQAQRDEERKREQARRSSSSRTGSGYYDGGAAAAATVAAVIDTTSSYSPPSCDTSVSVSCDSGGF